MCAMQTYRSYLGYEAKRSSSFALIFDDVSQDDEEKNGFIFDFGFVGTRESFRWIRCVVASSRSRFSDNTARCLVGKRSSHLPPLLLVESNKIDRKSGFFRLPLFRYTGNYLFCQRLDRRFLLDEARWINHRAQNGDSSSPWIGFYDLITRCAWSFKI